MQCNDKGSALATSAAAAAIDGLHLGGCRCKRLLGERDEARAEGYAEATLAVELSLEVDKLSECPASLSDSPIRLDGIHPGLCQNLLRLEKRALSPTAAEQATVSGVGRRLDLSYGLASVVPACRCQALVP